MQNWLAVSQGLFAGQVRDWFDSVYEMIYEIQQCILKMTQFAEQQSFPDVLLITCKVY